MLHAWSLILLNSPISPSLVDLSWLPLHFRFSFKIYLMHKISHSTSLSYLSNLSLPSKRSGVLVLNCSLSLSHSYAKSAFSFSGPLLWNFLTPNLKSSFYPTFLKSLKTFFFKQFIVKRL